MAQNFLYMFEFVVDDVLITRPNICAPEEYPTCCELTFRSHVFVSICDKKFGGCIDAASKSGKCCLFSLEAPVKESDRLQVHVFKKKTENCKFLIGATEVPVHKIFEKVTNDFYVKNPNWDGHLKAAKSNGKPSTSKKDKDNVVIDNDCGADMSAARKEQLSPTYELNKKLLSLSNMAGGMQTGNIVLVMRLACMGPTIVSPFPFGNQSTPTCSRKLSVPCKKDGVADTVICKRYFSSNAEKDCPCAECEDDCDRCHGKSYKKGEPCKQYSNVNGNGNGSAPRGCPCPNCDEECDRDENDDEEECSDITMKPCILCPSQPEYGPEKYEEFEANLNGSGLTIRVLKDSHMVEDVEHDNLSENYLMGNVTSNKDHPPYICENFNKLATTNTLIRNHIDRRTGGKINNDRSIPVVRGNIKYSGNDSCCGDSIKIPLLNKLPAPKSVDAYRKTADNIRSCCFQVQPNDIDNTLRGINATAKKKGIEVCYKTCDDPDTDVFLVRLGKKKPSQNKKSAIEIELRTPKEPTRIRAQKWTKETQVDESVLDATAKKKKGKGKKEKK